jgi:ATP-dependent Clp protease adaptor protein ClpS
MDDDRKMTDSNKSDGDSDSGVTVKEKAALPTLAEPPRFAVFLHNDDYTTMEFVVEILTIDFSKPSDVAVGIMLKVHQEGKAVAGIFPFDIAESKIAKVTEKARKQGYPLKLTMEPAPR